MRRAGWLYTLQMKTSTLAWNLVVIAIVIINFLPILGKRHKPRHDEIERVVNITHSVIWKCSNSECHPGSGLNVPCGISIPIRMRIICVSCVKGTNYSNTQDFSTCQSCKNCGKHEYKRGECTREEDTTECLGTCHKGFYMDKITDDCHPCSDCCDQADKHHEKQCEDSALPPHKQCRQTNVKCHHPIEADFSGKGHQPDSEGSLQNLEIAAIVISFAVVVVIIAIALVIWRCYGWQQVKITVKKCCCCFNNAETTVNFQISDHFEETHLESPTLCMSNSGSPLVTEETDGVGSLPSDIRVKTTKIISKRPGFKRQSSVPVETRANAKLKIPRSRSHPGCLVDLKSKKLAMKGYAPVATEVDDYPLVKIDKDCLPEPISNGHGKCTVQCGSTDEDQGKQRLEKPSVQDQGTSTTELHLFTSTLQAAGIPQDFLNILLKESMSAIPNKFYRKICIRLDTRRECFWDDFRLLGEKVGLDKDEIAWLLQRGNPTESIIQKFNSSTKNSCIAMFVSILEEMERNDVVEIIKEWILYEWAKHNNNYPSSNGGKVYNFQSFV